MEFGAAWFTVKGVVYSIEEYQKFVCEMPMSWGSSSLCTVLSTILEFPGCNFVEQPSREDFLFQ